MDSRQVGDRSIDPSSAPTPRGARDASRASVARIALVSTYPPRRCGIATFTADLGRALGDREIVALHGPDDTATDHPVHHVIRTDVRADYARAARSLDDCGVAAVSVQHEYGIWGASDGEGVLEFLAALSVPAVATLHTVLRRPTVGERRVMQGVLDGTAAVVVMSRAAAAILVDGYGADPARVVIIPHGVPDLPFVDPDRVKPALGLQGRPVLLSFGLVGPSKGYESVIEAMPEVVRAVPDACYVLLGATHPELLRTEGERYRTRLETLAADLGMTRHVMFIDRFVSQLELSRWLEAADVFVTPYPNLDQIVSGTLSYAMAAGKASVSTPYLYASEILAGGRGRLVSPGNPAAMSCALLELLQDHGLRSVMAQRAYLHGRGMIWSRVAADYQRLFTRLRDSQRDVAVLDIPKVAVPSA
jgi:glycosyltransferase involved in cell wall biosynthesis